jgi:predicted TIM-barrel fold metal-dependent hydrolase
MDRRMASVYSDTRKSNIGIVKTLLFLFMVAAIIPFAYSQDNPDPREPQPIIDIHMHTGLPHKIPAGTPSLCRPAPCKGTGGAIVDPSELLKKTLEVMDRYHIVKGFVSGVNLSVVREWKKAAPDRFIASPFILKPGSPTPAQLRKEYSEGHFGGLGEIGAELMGVAPNDPSLEPYFALAEELDLPVLIHTLGIGPYMPSFRSSAGNPLLLEKVLVHHPKLRLWVENAGFPYQEEMIAMMYQYPQLYADVSTITWVIPRAAFYDYLKTFIRAGLGKRLMFGSDQMYWPEKIGEGIEAIKEASFLSDEQKRDILYNNAARFLRLAGAGDD